MLHGAGIFSNMLSQKSPTVREYTSSMEHMGYPINLPFGNDFRMFAHPRGPDQVAPFHGTLPWCECSRATDPWPICGGSMVGFFFGEFYGKPWAFT